MPVRNRASQAELSRILGCSPNTISNAKKDPTFPDADSDSRYEIKAVVIWWHVHKEGGCSSRTGSDDEDMFAGADSPNLERYRKLRADREQVLIGQLVGNLIELDKFCQEFGDALMPYRRCAEAFRRQGMTEAFEMLREAGNEVVRNLADGFELDSDG